MKFSIKDENYLENYNEIWEKVNNIIKKKKKINREPVINKKF